MHYTQQQRLLRTPLELMQWAGVDLGSPQPIRDAVAYVGRLIDELEAAVRACCEPIFDRPLKDISFGQILLRLFQTSRRFNVEVQPQLVLLQKTLLNIEGLGRQLDPDLDLWKTAKPYLERWMGDQVGIQGMVERLKAEAPRFTHIIPQLPRLVHRALLQSAEPHAASGELLRVERVRVKVCAIHMQRDSESIAIVRAMRAIERESVKSVVMG